MPLLCKCKLVSLYFVFFFFFFFNFITLTLVPINSVCSLYALVFTGILFRVDNYSTEYSIGKSHFEYACTYKLCTL